jgi:hypothetical protein
MITYCLSSVTRTALIISLFFSGIACVQSDANSNSAKPKGNEMNFKFENYNVKAPEAAKDKLTQLFPKGSSLKDFQASMEKLGAQCYDNSENKEEEALFCHYMAGNNFTFIKTNWVVGVKANHDVIEELSVKAGLMGP